MRVRGDVPGDPPKGVQPGHAERISAPERETQALIQRLSRGDVTKPGACRLWRNNVGLLYTQDGRPVRVGLCPGSADLVGFVTREIGGQNVAVIAALEVKSARGRVSEDQARWLALVRQAGGIGAVVRSAEEARQALGLPPDER